MADTWTVDFLTVSRHGEPPSETVVIRALASAGFGTAEYTPAPPANDSAPSTGRRRLGTYALQEPNGRATGRILVARYDEPVLTGMGDAAFTTLTRGLGADDVRTLREGRLALDLRVTVKDPADGVFLAWATRVLLVLLGFTEGAGIDPATQRCYGRVELAQLAAAVSPLPHVAIHAEPGGADTCWLHTHGMQKFARPELDLLGVPVAYEAEGRALLADLTDSLARGARLMPGQEVDLDELGRVVAISVTADEDHQAPFGRLRLVDAPAPGERPGETANRLLARTVLADATRRADRGDVTGAFDAIERALAADPENSVALSIKARLHLRAGQVLEALNIGELMELRAPMDYRGPLIVGHALAALGRAREAELAYTRAIERNPDDGEAFAARAAAFERLGQAREAAADRSRAAYLRA
ncbi:MAG: hypothetical protein PVSMB4_15560 [Ktedonobacterales bacterium]